MEKAVLRRIRTLSIRDTHLTNKKDIETIRDKVVAKMCDEDRNFARHYMNYIIRDMRFLQLRRGLELESEENILIEESMDEDSSKKSKFAGLESVLFQLFKQLCQFIDMEK